MPVPAQGRLWRRASFIVAALLLAYCVWNGFAGAWSQRSAAETTAQAGQTILQVLYGALSLAALITCFRWRRLQPLALIGWVASVGLNGTVASIVWGRTSIVVGVVSGLAAVLVAALVAAMLRAGLRGFGDSRPE